MKHCLQYVLEHCSEDLDFFAQQNDKTLVQRMQVRCSCIVEHFGHDCTHSVTVRALMLQAMIAIQSHSQSMFYTRTPSCHHVYI